MHHHQVNLPREKFFLSWVPSDLRCSLRVITRSTKARVKVTSILMYAENCERNARNQSTYNSPAKYAWCSKVDGISTDIADSGVGNWLTSRQERWNPPSASACQYCPTQRNYEKNLDIWKKVTQLLGHCTLESIKTDRVHALLQGHTRQPRGWTLGDQKCYRLKLVCRKWRTDGKTTDT